jgi:hypothetical protein
MVDGELETPSCVGILYNISLFSNFVPKPLPTLHIVTISCKIPSRSLASSLPYRVFLERPCPYFPDHVGEEVHIILQYPDPSRSCVSALPYRTFLERPCPYFPDHVGEEVHIILQYPDPVSTFSLILGPRDVD